MRVWQPAADKDLARDCHDELHDMSKSEVQLMVGDHLLWKDYNTDEMLSWSVSMIFVIAHAQGRFYKGQTGCTIAMIDRRKTSRPATRTRPADGNSPFYWALRLYESYNVGYWKGRSAQDSHQGGLHPRIFTHEILSHGTVLYPETDDPTVSLKQMERGGLFELYPEFGIPKKMRPTGLYERCVALRQRFFPSHYPRVYVGPTPPRKAFTAKEIDWALKTAGKFVTNGRAPLHLVLMLLGMRERPSEDPLFMTMIRNNYMVGDLESSFNRNIAPVADNVPEYIQYYDLVRDACIALSAPTLPDTVVHRSMPKWRGDHRSMYKEEDQRILERWEDKARLYTRVSTPWELYKAQETKKENAQMRKRAQEKARKRVDMEEQRAAKRARLSDQVEMEIQAEKSQEEEEKEMEEEEEEEVEDTDTDSDEEEMHELGDRLDGPDVDFWTRMRGSIPKARADATGSSTDHGLMDFYDLESDGEDEGEDVNELLEENEQNERKVKMPKSRKMLMKTPRDEETGAEV